MKPRMYQNKTAETAERDPVQVLYKAYKDKRPENMLKPDSPFYLAVNYFKTEGELKSEGSKWFKSQPMGINKLNSLIQLNERNDQIGGNLCENKSQWKENTLLQKLQDNNVLPNQIVQITGHKNLQSINNYSSLRERQMENISKILSSSSSERRMPYCQQYSIISYKVILLRHIHRLQPLKTHSKQCFKEIMSLEVFSISICHRLKMQSQVQNGGRKRKKAI